MKFLKELGELIDGLLFVGISLFITIKIFLGVINVCPKDTEWWIAVSALYIVLFLQRGLAKVKFDFSEDTIGIIRTKKLNEHIEKKDPPINPNNGPDKAADPGPGREVS